MFPNFGENASKPTIHIYGVAPKISGQKLTRYKKFEVDLDFLPYQSNLSVPKMPSRFKRRVYICLQKRI
ncbi:hypothetical protein BVRB_5g110210 isoform B [Beta vulgaris subsp. vulgaris]|uniref:Uncharacterized protein n=1 Tax=Beta vulgaris subsp. vulgaris TaxID=3555 RepID=A0A0J8CGT9_BETVV|nr:hypothetical protein BVRB_5g110210 isoform B [Beta vulgaris subsp. vulgaris]